MLRMPGRFNVENALIATATTAAARVGVAYIKAGFKETAVKGRTQVLQETAHFPHF